MGLSLVSSSWVARHHGVVARVVVVMVPPGGADSDHGGTKMIRQCCPMHRSVWPQQWFRQPWRLIVSSAMSAKQRGKTTRPSRVLFAGGGPAHGQFDGGAARSQMPATGNAMVRWEGRGGTVSRHIIYIYIRSFAVRVIVGIHTCTDIHM